MHAFNRRGFPNGKPNIYRMALGFFNLGPGTACSAKLGSQAFFGGPKILVTLCEKKRVTNLELILTHMHRTGRQRPFLEPLHSFLDKNSVNERAPFPRVYASLVSSLGATNSDVFCYIFAFSDLQSTFL